VIENEFIDNILDLDRKFSEKFGISFVRTEAKIILLLKKNGSLSIKELMSFTDVSYRGFYIILKKMIEKNHLSVKSDTKDGRVKRLVLNDICNDY
jgi:DNA-binding MarR family transcriptional regulator